MKRSKHIYWLALALGLGLWVLDAALDFLFFYEAGFFALLIADVPAHEIYVRGTAIALFLAFAWLARRMLGRQEAALERSEALQSSLSALGAVNRIILEEGDGAGMMEQALELVTNQLGYDDAWALFDSEFAEEKRFLQRNCSGDLGRLEAEVRAGSVHCIGARALAVGSFLASQDCGNCPRAQSSPNRRSLSASLACFGRDYGTLTVSVAGRPLSEERERKLFGELARNLALGLHLRHARRTLERRNDELDRAQRVAGVGSWEFDLETRQVRGE